MKRVILRLRSPLLAGEVHSDTLFGALCWGYRWLYGREALEELLKGFKSGEPPFLISSCFPYLEADGKRVYLYPKPAAFEPLAGGAEQVENSCGKTVKEDVEMMKKFKKLRYVSERLFRKMCNSRKIETTESRKLHKKKVPSFKVDGEWYVISDGVALEAEVAEKLVEEKEECRFSRKSLRIIRKYEKPGVQVNRLSISPEETLHFRSEYSLAPDAGLYFLIDGNSKALSEIKAVLRFLADRGIGGEVSCGRGAFEVCGWEDVSLDKPGDAFVTLSLYLPKREELSAFDEDRIWYEPVVRKGMVESSFVKIRNQWKDKLLMFAEGSVFPAAGREPFGRCEVVKEEPFEVLHYGYAFAVGFRRGEDG